MKIAVCLKAVAGQAIDVHPAANGRGIEFDGRYFSMNESDEYALEEALVLKKELGGEVTVVTLGRITTQDILYVAIAKGADRGVRVDCASQDPDVVSDVLAESLRRLEFDLVLTGVQADDDMGARVGVTVAEKLGIPFAFGVVGVTPQDQGLKVTKELGGGRLAVLEMPLPSLLCVQTGIQPLSYAIPARVIRARQQRLQVFYLPDLGLDEAALDAAGRYRVLEAYQPEKGAGAEILTGDPASVVAQIMARIGEVI